MTALATRQSGTVRGTSYYGDAAVAQIRAIRCGSVHLVAIRPSADSSILHLFHLCEGELSTFLGYLRGVTSFTGVDFACDVERDGCTLFYAGMIVLSRKASATASAFQDATPQPAEVITALINGSGGRVLFGSTLWRVLVHCAQIVVVPD
jgi:hypothetical protein